MRAFKKLMAATIATAMAATMATSAFAAELNSNGKMVLSETESYTAAGQTTVLVVPYDNWVEASDQTWSITGLTDADILYINQWETTAEAQAAITEGLGVKLTEGTLADGDYYVLFGGNTGTAGAFAISAFKCTVSSAPEAPTIVLGDVDGVGGITTDDLVAMAKHIGKMAVITDETLLANANVDKTGDVTTDDLVLLAKYIGKMIDSFE